MVEAFQNIPKEVLRERITGKIENMLEGVRGRGPNNFRVKQYLLYASMLDSWVQDPLSIQSPVPSYFKDVRFDPDAKLIVFATDPWEDEHYAYEGGQFVQARLIPSHMRTGAVVYTLFLKEYDDPKFQKHEEIPYLSNLPSYTQFLPRRASFGITISGEILGTFYTFLENARPLPPR